MTITTCACNAGLYRGRDGRDHCTACDAPAGTEPGGWIEIDLTGSNAGPAFRSVVAELDRFDDEDAVRRSAAEHYDVPLEQVGPILPEPPAGWHDD